MTDEQQEAVTGTDRSFDRWLSPDFLNSPICGENPLTNANASLLQNRFRPLHYVAAY
ncbi:hypothetical protein [Paenibacillus pabuli]|uniref:hypothetical protein n=1 Tax=Paenibacillus pabuli TaxID=1472 RepID=UPI003CE89FE8